MKPRIIRENSWLLKIGGRWQTTSGIDVTKFLWSIDKKFWFWITSMPEELIEVLLPQVSEKYLNEKGEKKFQATIFETNNYRARMIHKLAKYAKKSHIYEFNNLMKILVRSSKSFRIWIYDSTSDFKVKDKTPRGIMQSHLKFQKMVRNGIPNFKFKRVWIPKADGTQRPLAVPNLEDRWLAKIMLEFTLIWLQGKGKNFHENQFGSISGRSCAQAWNKVIQDIVPKKFILEFDIAKCYDTLSWDGIWKWMLHCDFPQGIQNYILKTITTAGRNLPKEEYRAELNKMRRVKLLDQTDLWNIGKAWDDRLINRMAGYARSWFEREYLDKWEKWEKIMATQLEMAKIRESLGQKPMINADTKDMPAEIIGRLKEHIKMKKMGVPVGAENMFDNRFNRLEMFDTGLGIPQGWALSPLLCNYQIKAAFKAVKKAEWVTYLDDGILGSDSIEDLNLNELLRRLSAVGLRMHPHKTKLCKENGRWNHDIKFLGALLRADGKFLAATRKGASQILLTPPTTILSGKEAKNIEWNEVGLNFFKEVQLDEAQLAWIYNNGGVFDSNGNWTPVHVGKMWQKSWGSLRMNLWKVRNPDLAIKIDTWLERERTTY